ncbi:hypothetical protein [Macrococcus equipercicus]|uniref:Uncharacterized protein n=1 Tax=Macrococcus equipercicus TaxID=69967 RepID=A0A9Q9BVB1_9STAP|nr:hypothetical protein [Macrococcus equipercicus]UTH13012.1 hypothetical protein KFV11_06940 [Macrococcus equipercicus]
MVKSVFEIIQETPLQISDEHLLNLFINENIILNEYEDNKEEPAYKRQLDRLNILNHELSQRNLLEKAKMSVDKDTVNQKVKKDFLAIKKELEILQENDTTSSRIEQLKIVLVELIVNGRYVSEELKQEILDYLLSKKATPQDTNDEAAYEPNFLMELM